MTQADKFLNSILTSLPREYNKYHTPISGIRNNRLLAGTLPEELFRLPDTYIEL